MIKGKRDVKSPKPKVVISMGDPVGIGPEVILKALSRRSVLRAVEPLVVGDEGLLRKVAAKLKVRYPEGKVLSASRLDLRHLKRGLPTVASSKEMISYIERGVELCQDGMSRGEAWGLVTGPISKEGAKLSGFAFPGHTEFLAHLTGSRNFGMAFYSGDLRVILATIHEPISKVPSLITKSRVLKIIKLLNDFLRKDLGIRSPKIGVCGLNPHGGEGGLFGMEDKKKILPAVKEAVKAGIKASGPLPGDTVFFRALQGDFHGVVAMYHDQGLAPFKLIHFNDGVNVTLGLKIVRTSPDHGTAYDKAWKGVAGDESIREAILLAGRMAAGRHKQGIKHR